MPALIEKWTSMVTEVTGGLSGLVIVIAVLAIAVLVIMSIVTHNDVEKAAKIKSFVWVLAVVAVFAVGSQLVNWAVSGV